MGNPDDLLDAICAKLRKIPGVLAMVKDLPENIAPYLDDEPSVLEAVNAMPLPSILVVLEMSDNGEFEKAQYAYNFLAYLRLPEERTGTAFYRICSGVATGDNMPFTLAEIHPDFEMIGLPNLRRDTDEDQVEYPAISMRFRDKNID